MSCPTCAAHQREADLSSAAQRRTWRALQEALRQLEDTQRECEELRLSIRNLTYKKKSAQEG